MLASVKASYRHLKLIIHIIFAIFSAMFFAYSSNDRY